MLVFLFCKQSTIKGIAHANLDPIAYPHKPPLNAHADVFSRVKDQQFDLSLNLYPCFVYVGSEDSSESSPFA